MGFFKKFKKSFKNPFRSVGSSLLTVATGGISAVAPAIIGSSGIGGILDNTLFRGQAAQREAAKEQRKTTQQVIAAQQARDAQTRLDLEPFLNLGQRAAGTRSGALRPFSEFRAGSGDDINDFGLPDFTFDDRFRQQQEEGERALKRIQSARGFTLSGAGAASLLDFNRGITNDAITRSEVRESEALRLGQNSAVLQGSLGQQNTNAQTAALQLGTENTNQFRIQREAEIKNEVGDIFEFGSTLFGGA